MAKHVRLLGSAAIVGVLGLEALVPATVLAQDQGQVAMSRLYNPNSGEHFYTADTNERDHLVQVGWRYEGVGWVAPARSSAPVYRLYNPNAGDHHYTTSTAERDWLVRKGWRYEGVGWYSSDAKSVPLYRQYNPNAAAGAHNYTASKGESDHLSSVGWRYEGVCWYGVRHEHAWATRTVTDRAGHYENVVNQPAWDEPIYEDRPVYDRATECNIFDPLGEGTVEVRTDDDFEAVMSDMSKCYEEVSFCSDDSDWNYEKGGDYQLTKAGWAADNDLPTTARVEDPDNPGSYYWTDRWPAETPTHEYQVGTERVQVGTTHHDATYKRVWVPAVTHEETYCTICGKVRGE
jgi:hypothetical protein